MSRIALDVAGGEAGYEPPIMGAIAALREEPSLEIVAVGDSDSIHRIINRIGVSERLKIHHAPEVITMETDVKQAARMTNSSLYQTIALTKDDYEDAGLRSDAAVSPGCSPALVLLAHTHIGMIDRVKRPAFVFVCPTPSGNKVVTDGGANKICSARDIAEFTVMGGLFAELVLGIPSPQSGLFAIGEEGYKAMPTVKEAMDLLQTYRLPHSKIPTLIEPDKFMTDGYVQVGVADGLIGNFILKSYEGAAKATGAKIKEFLKGLGVRALFLRNDKIKTDMKHAIYPVRLAHAHWWGGKKDVIKVHGGCSDPEVFCGAILCANDIASSGVISKVAERLQQWPTIPK